MGIPVAATWQVWRHGWVDGAEGLTGLGMSLSHRELQRGREGLTGLGMSLSHRELQRGREGLTGLGMSLSHRELQRGRTASIPLDVRPALERGSQ